MQQDATSRVDQEGIRESAEMKVDDWTEHCVDRDIHASDSLKFAVGNDWQTGRRHHTYDVI